MTSERDFSAQTEGVQFIPSDFDPIPYTNSIWLPKGVSRQATSIWARYWNRKGLDIRMIGTNNQEETLAIIRNGPTKFLSKEFRDQRLKASEFGCNLNKYASKFQQRLWKTEPLPPAIVGTVTIPEYDIALHKACNVNREEIKTEQ